MSKGESRILSTGQSAPLNPLNNNFWKKKKRFPVSQGNMEVTFCHIIHSKAWGKSDQQVHNLWKWRLPPVLYLMNSEDRCLP